jgi:hypothetical protein
MSPLSNFLSSAVEKLLFHPVTITHAETIGGRFRRVRLQGDVLKGVKWVPDEARVYTDGDGAGCGLG